MRSRALLSISCQHTPATSPVALGQLAHPEHVGDRDGPQMTLDQHVVIHEGNPRRDDAGLDACHGGHPLSLWKLTFSHLIRFASAWTWRAVPRQQFAVPVVLSPAETLDAPQLRGGEDGKHLRAAGVGHQRRSDLSHWPPDPVQGLIRCRDRRAWRRSLA